VIPLGTNMPLDELGIVARKKHCSAIVLSGAIEPSQKTLSKDLPRLVEAVGIPVLVGGLSSVYACDDINRAGAEALGRDVDHGLERLNDILQ
jgi:cobalamin-dependent methionine synthase I